MRSVLLIIALLLVGCPSPSDQTRAPALKEDLNGRRERVETDAIVGLKGLLPELAKILEKSPARSSVLNDPRFRRIYDNPAPHVELVLGVLRDPDVPVEQKFVAILSMDGLQLEDLLAFLRNCHGLASAGVMPESLLAACLIPGPGFKNQIVKEYKDARVRSVLDDIANDNSLKENHREGVQRLLSGHINEDMYPNSGSLIERLWRKVRLMN